MLDGAEASYYGSWSVSYGSGKRRPMDAFYGSLYNTEQQATVSLNEQTILSLLSTCYE